MDNEELAFNAWILIGNVLQTLLRGAGANAATDLDQAELTHLDEALQPIQPPQMLETLRSLSETQRHLLHEATKRAFALAGTEAESVLGLTENDAHPVLAFLANPGLSLKLLQR